MGRFCLLLGISSWMEQRNMAVIRMVMETPYSFCFCMKLFYRKYNLCNMHILMKQPFSRKSDSARFFLRISGNIRGIILGKAILLPITGGAHIRDWKRRQILFRVSLFSDNCLPVPGENALPRYHLSVHGKLQN